jgi:GNAT superfamily N-acetyltransferase
MSQELRLLEGLPPEDEQAILDLLRAYNVANFGERDRRDLAIPIYDDSNEVIGGLVGYTGRGWLYVQMLFIPENMRGQGIADRLLRMAEDEAQARGCIGAYIDSMNPDAVKAYQKYGYEIAGHVGPLTAGNNVTWLSKRFR